MVWCCLYLCVCSKHCSCLNIHPIPDDWKSDEWSYPFTVIGLGMGMWYISGQWHRREVSWTESGEGPHVLGDIEEIVLSDSGYCHGWMWPTRTTIATSLSAWQRRWRESGLLIHWRSNQPILEPALTLSFLLCDVVHFLIVEAILSHSLLLSAT